jgi:hypothetical protein
MGKNSYHHKFCNRHLKDSFDLIRPCRIHRDYTSSISSSFILRLAIWKKVKHKNLKFKCPLIHCNSGRLNSTSKALSVKKTKEKSITEQRPDISNCDASRRSIHWLIATVLWWTRWQLDACINCGRWHYVQEQRWPTDRPPSTKRLNLFQFKDKS